MSIKQISIFVENKPGALYGLTGVLAQNKVDLRALSLAETSEFGIVRIIVNDVYKATTVLKDAATSTPLPPWWASSFLMCRRPQPGAPGTLQRQDQRGVHVCIPGGQDRSRLYDLPGRGQQCRGGALAPGASRPWRKRISSECKAKQLSRKRTDRAPAGARSAFSDPVVEGGDSLGASCPKREERGTRSTVFPSSQGRAAPAMAEKTASCSPSWSTTTR